MELVWPSSLHLPSYVAALQRGWSPDNTRGAAAAADELAAIEADPATFIASLIDREAKGTPVAVVAWKQRRGYATRALGLLLAQNQGEGLPFVELTTDAGNLASQRVIEANGGRLIETFTKPAQFGFKPGFRYRIDMPLRPAHDSPHQPADPQRPRRDLR
jgi:hypothetical protein